MKRQGTRDRKERFNKRHDGQAASSSQDFLHLVAQLFGYSKKAAALSANHNWSSYTYAGLPMLLAALQALVVEYEFVLHPRGALEPPTDINSPAFVKNYKISGTLLEDFNNLVELRNEIIHPAHATTGTPDNWPAYLTPIKGRGLLNTTGDPKADYALLGQMASHQLFDWAIEVVRSMYEIIIMSDPNRAPLFIPFLRTFDEPWFRFYFDYATSL